jgi:hypothetical protein
MIFSNTGLGAGLGNIFGELMEDGTQALTWFSLPLQWLFGLFN